MTSVERKRSLEYDFATSTTMHGLSRIADSANGALTIAWIVGTLLCLGVCAWQISLRFVDFFEFNVNTEILVIHRHSLEFPAITICNFNRYRSTELDNDTLQVLPLFTWSAYGSDGNTFLDLFAESANITEVQTILDELHSTGFTIETFTREKGFSLERSLAHCQWKGRLCSSENFTHVFTKFGNCYTFNGPSQDEYLEQTMPGFGNGLSLVVDIDQYSYTESINGNPEAGLKFLVHSKHEPPLMSSQGYAVQPGTKAFVSISQIQSVNLPRPWGDCDQDSRLNYYDSYSMSGCILERQLQVIKDQCSCRPIGFPGNDTVCDILSMLQCVDPLMGYIDNSRDIVPCSVPCNYTSYPITISYATVPSYSVSEDYRSFYGLPLEYTRENFVYVDIYYSELSYQQYTQTKAMTESALLSDIGGQLGLFIGASVITLLEYLEYLGKRAIRCCSSKKTQVSDLTMVQPISIRD
ncbi:bile acid-sensitive ion channel-like [Glandiceps talaboti]